MKLSERQLKIIQHSLGVDKFGQGEQYRNRFVTDPHIDDGKECAKMCAMGMMGDCGAMEITSGMHCYYVTEQGKVAMLEQSPRAPELTRSQRRYRKYLKISDALNVTFGEWLKRTSE